jgi:hypothetical protein
MAPIIPHTVQTIRPHSDRTGSSSGSQSALIGADIGLSRRADRGSHGREHGPS